MTHAGGDYRYPVFLLPTLHQVPFGVVTPNHKGRTALRMNEIDSNAGQLSDPLVINFHGPQIFILGMLLRTNEKRYDSDSIRQEPDEIDQRSRLVGRLDHTNDSTPVRVRHLLPPSYSCIDQKTVTSR